MQCIATVIHFYKGKKNKVINQMTNFTILNTCAARNTCHNMKKKKLNLPINKF